MPAIVSHWLLGRKILPEISAHISSVTIDSNCFLWGCQGPDVLFFQRLMPWMFGQNVRIYGSKIHKGSPSQLFCSLAELLDVCEASAYDRMLSYCLGMCCHYGFDRTAHPYVNWLEDRLRQTDERGVDYNYHGEIESMLDVILLRNEMGLIPSDIHLADCIPSDRSVTALLALVFTKLLYGMFGVKLEQRIARLLASDMRTCFKVLDDPYTLRRPFVKLCESVLRKDNNDGAMSAFMRPLAEDTDYDYGNFCHEEWFNIVKPEQRSTKSFIELYNDAAEDSCLMADHFLSAVRGVGSFEQYTEERTFENGVREG